MSERSSTDLGGGRLATAVPTAIQEKSRGFGGWPWAVKNLVLREGIVNLRIRRFCSVWRTVF